MEKYEIVKGTNELTIKIKDIAILIYDNKLSINIFNKNNGEYEEYENIDLKEV